MFWTSCPISNPFLYLQQEGLNLPIFRFMNAEEQANVIEAHIRKDSATTFKMEKAIRNFINWHLPDIAGSDAQYWKGWLSRNGPELQIALEKMLVKFFKDMRSQQQFVLPRELMV